MQAIADEFKEVKQSDVISFSKSVNDNYTWTVSLRGPVSTFSFRRKRHCKLIRMSFNSDFLIHTHKIHPKLW